MNKLKVSLENCYGIKKLEYDFDFSNCHTFVIYAPNGAMKTSFTKTFRDVAKGDIPHDQVDGTLSPIYDLSIDDSGSKIDPKEILIIESYNEKAFNSEEKILTLLADEETRKKYLSIYTEIELLKKTTLSNLKKLTGSSNYETEIIESFSNLGKKNIYEIFDSILNNIKSSNDSFNFKYNDVFDKSHKVRDFLQVNYSLLRQYIDKYNELITQSDFFSKNSDYVFGTAEAKNLEKTLQGNEYFFAGHKLVLKSALNVSDDKMLSEIINQEISKVFQDENLKQIFVKIDASLNANKELQSFKKVIEQDPSVLLRLDDYDKFRREVWFSFLKKIETGIESIVDLYNKKKPDLEKIIKEANDKKSEWDDAIQEFENRFVNVPFTINVNNKTDAVLNEETPAIDFKFKGKDIERKSLVENILSQGEKRAFYLLNVIFEIKSRKIQNKETLCIIDDIADSFDYKNKYAIVEYLHDISNEPNFYSIILTHNFDFFRTLQSRILGDNKWTNSLIAEKLISEIKLIDAGSKNVTDPFSNWKKRVKNDEKCLIACIPFVRNLIEFTVGTKNNDYRLLTHVLHQKKEDTINNIKSTNDICINDLEPIFSRILSIPSFEYTDKSKKIVDIIDSLIADIKSQPNLDSIVLEDKIILTIGARLKVDSYMWSKVTKQDPINGSQTGLLFQRYKDEFKDNPAHKDKITVLESVNIMTPENIHLNSFMYEPILDMGIDELKDLYEKASQLT